MPDRTLRRWITVNNYMETEYRDLIVEIALTYREHASPELRKMAGSALSSIVVPGFRNFQKVPVSVAIPYVVKQFQKRRDVTLAIINLWSEACQDVITEVKSQAVSKGLFFKEPWTWREAQNGYYAFEDIPEFNSIVDPLVAEKDKAEHDHWMLAELWLSAGLIDQPAIQVLQEPVMNVSSTVTDDIDHPLTNAAKLMVEEEIVLAQNNSQVIEESTETLLPSVTDAKPIEEVHQEDEWESLGLVDLLREGEQVEMQVEVTQTNLLALVQDVHQAVERMDVSQTKTDVDVLPAHFNDWQIALDRAESLANYAVYRLQREFILRPDMDQFKYLEQPALKNLKAGFEAVLAYDARKQNILKILEQLNFENSAVEKEWLEWKDASEFLEDFPQTLTANEPVDLTLARLEERERIVRSRIGALKSQTQQAREASLTRIRSHLENLFELVEDHSQVLVDGKVIGQYNNIDFSVWNGLQIRQLETALQAELNRQLVKSKPGKVVDFSAALLNDWNNKSFYELLCCLAADHRDAEVLLILLAAALGREKTEPVILSPDVYTSMVGGLLMFAGNSEPFNLIGQSLPILLNGYRLESERSIANLCVLSLAVHYSNTYQLPEGLLWQVADEWPLDGMPGWNKLWQSALLGRKCPIFSDPKQTELLNKLEQARLKAEKDFTRDGAHFIRLSSLQSFRHSSMMTRLLQDLAEKLDTLKKQDNHLASAKIDQLPGLVTRLAEKLDNQLFKMLEESELREMYEAGIRADKIDDSNPFHQRVSLRILTECADSIKEYGEALLALWDLITQRMTGLNSETLRSELKVLPNVSDLEEKAAERVIQAEAQDQKVWNDSIYEELKQRLIGELLIQPSFTLRLPRLVCHVVEVSLNWSDVLKILLEDLATPLEPAEIASYLLDHQAPNQVLGLVQFIPLEMQSRAQSLRSENEHLYDRLTLELLNLGGIANDLSSMREAGRWGWLLGELKRRIGSLRTQVDEENREKENLARAFRKIIQKLDDEIFDTKGQIPHDAYELLQHGLELARRACTNKESFSYLDEYLREIQYRVLHKSWSLMPIQQATEQIEKSLAGKKDFHDRDLTAERVLELLELNELEVLGVSKIEASEVSTRITVLSNWLKVKKIHTVLGKDLLQTEITSVQALFSYFARMMSMAHFYTQNGKSLDAIDPILLEYWEMRYPRSNVLDNQYVFITLPGDPPSTKDIQILENILEEKEILEYYFVLLFVPGCTNKLYKRLQRKGLVVIDGPRLIDMILAEANNNIPLGILRPMILNAIEANADIFITNQSVNNRTSIFVGRDQLVDRIANGGDNHAIYGGRRIGKSSVLKAVGERLGKRGYRVVSLSLEGEEDFTDQYISLRLARMLGINALMVETGSFKQALVSYMENDPELKLAILLDEVDRYIEVNSERHILIEALRTCSDSFGNRFRVLIAGFMNLYDCLNGGGPYTPNSDPWQRMFTDSRELENLTPAYAERIVREGFISILGWKFDNWDIPQQIVIRTGSHPAFVQEFCLKLLERVRLRKDQTIRMDDVESVFNDQDPHNSFIAYVQETLNLNLEPVSNYLIIWLAVDSVEAQGFTMDKIRSIASMSEVPIPEELLKRSVDLLKVTSVIRERMPDVFDFTVPDYPLILNRLGNTSHLDDVINQLKDALK